MLLANLAPFLGAGTIGFAFTGSDVSTVTGSGLGNFARLLQSFIATAVEITYESHAFVPDPPPPVPEPATWAMLIVGFGLIGFVARRRTAATTVLG